MSASSSFFFRRGSEFEFLGDSFDTEYAASCAFGGPLFRATADVPRESHDAVLCRDTDVSCFDAWLPIELIKYSLLQGAVCHRHYHRHYLSLLRKPARRAGSRGNIAKIERIKKRTLTCINSSGQSETVTSM